MKNPKFFALIIGTEILNRRRVDAHFDFVSKELAKYGNTLFGSFVITDEPELIISTIKYIGSIKDSVIFSFGGIGSTPDDYTRQCVADAFGEILEIHEECQNLIKTRMIEDNKMSSYALDMAKLPPKSELLVRDYAYGIPAFHLQKRFFFMPGFPYMSHPIIENIQKEFFPEQNKNYRYTFTANCKESLFIKTMRNMLKEVDVSSLPTNTPNGWQTTISVISRDQKLALETFELYINILKKDNIEYFIDEI